MTAAITVAAEPITNLSEHAGISSRFSVERLLQPVARMTDPAATSFVEVSVASPWVKDYDEQGNGPLSWPERFDLSSWELLAAYDGGNHVGGAVMAWNTPGLTMLEGSEDLAVVWDLRVRVDMRGLGVGTALWQAAEEWARARGCRTLKVETQNVNVPACRFYARMGCTLGAIQFDAYPDHPDEVQLLWYRTL